MQRVVLSSGLQQLSLTAVQGTVQKINDCDLVEERTPLHNISLSHEVSRDNEESIVHFFGSIEGPSDSHDACFVVTPE